MPKSAPRTDSSGIEAGGVFHTNIIREGRKRFIEWMNKRRKDDIKNRKKTAVAGIRG